jgi:hypothetical protein
MSEVTVFSAPKPFLDPHIKIIQRNAVRSWKELGFDVEVILIGDDPGIREAALDLDVNHIPGVEVNQLGTPLINSIFSLARKASTSELLLYINADIILMPGAMQVIMDVHQKKKEFLLVGRRWDLDISGEITFANNWSDRIKGRIEEDGRLQTPHAMDYFIFPRHLYQEIPPFAVGRAGWDNWMVYHGIKQAWPVIDATAPLLIVHQNHDYAHLPDGAPHYNLEESHKNVSLAGGIRNTYDLVDVPWYLKNGRILRKKISFVRFLRKMERIITPSERKGWRWKVTSILKRTQRKLSKDW